MHGKSLIKTVVISIYTALKPHRREKKHYLTTTKIRSTALLGDVHFLSAKSNGSRFPRIDTSKDRLYGPQQHKRILYYLREQSARHH